MIIVSRKYGQLGNRLIVFAHLIASAREFGFKIYNPAFAEYAKYFESTKNDIWCRYPIEAPPTSSQEPPSEFRRQMAYSSVYLSTRLLSHLRMTRFPLNIMRINADRCVDVAEAPFRELACSSRPLAISGWQFRNNDLLKKHIDAIRDHFHIVEPHRERVTQLVSGIRQQAECVIGVHIRHGDYATWQGGKWFYSVDQYAEVMRRIRARLAGTDVAFLVCGNAEMSRSDFGDLNVHFGTGHLIEDLYAFAETDFLTGPPSTFTRWAGLYGNVPLQFIENADQELSLEKLMARRSAAA